jgi:hypothetical protein
MDLNKFPELCFVVVLGNKPGERVGIVKRGEVGYYRTDLDDAKSDLDALALYVATLNETLGVDQPTALAMEIGSMFGWDKPGADPERHRKVSADRMKRFVWH